jgi:Zn ribbon nucleic-acid-binding protein
MVIFLSIWSINGKGIKGSLPQLNLLMKIAKFDTIVCPGCLKRVMALVNVEEGQVIGITCLQCGYGSHSVQDPFPNSVTPDKRHFSKPMKPTYYDSRPVERPLKKSWFSRIFRKRLARVCPRRT